MKLTSGKWQKAFSSQQTKKNKVWAAGAEKHQRPIGNFTNDRALLRAKCRLWWLRSIRPLRRVCRKKLQVPLPDEKSSDAFASELFIMVTRTRISHGLKSVHRTLFAPASQGPAFRFPDDPFPKKSSDAFASELFIMVTRTGIEPMLPP